MVDFLLLSFITRGHLDLQTSNTGENHVFSWKMGGASTPIDGRFFTLILSDFDAGYAYPGSQTWP